MPSLTQDFRTKHVDARNKRPQPLQHRKRERRALLESHVLVPGLSVGFRLADLFPLATVLP